MNIENPTNIAPSWSEAARIIAMVIEHGDSEGRQKILAEVKRMGQIIDDLQETLSSNGAEEEKGGLTDLGECVATSAGRYPAPEYWAEVPEDCHVNYAERLRFVSPCPEGYDTVLGYLAAVDPWSLLAGLWDPEATQRDGFWCKHRCERKAFDVIKVPAPAVLVEQGIRTVNAYPVEVLKERLGH